MTRTEQETLELAASTLPGERAFALEHLPSIVELCGVLARRVIALEAAVKMTPMTPLAMAEEAVAGIDEPQVRAAARKMLGLDS